MSTIFSVIVLFQSFSLLKDANDSRNIKLVWSNEQEIVVKLLNFYPWKMLHILNVRVLNERWNNHVISQTIRNENHLISIALNVQYNYSVGVVAIDDGCAKIKSIHELRVRCCATKRFAIKRFKHFIHFTLLKLCVFIVMFHITFELLPHRRDFHFNSQFQNLIVRFSNEVIDLSARIYANGTATHFQRYYKPFFFFLGIFGERNLNMKLLCIEWWSSKCVYNLNGWINWSIEMSVLLTKSKAQRRANSMPIALILVCTCKGECKLRIRKKHRGHNRN